MRQILFLLYLTILYDTSRLSSFASTASGLMVWRRRMVPSGAKRMKAGVLTAVVGLLACCSDPEVVAAAKAKASEWFD